MSPRQIADIERVPSNRRNTAPANIHWRRRPYDIVAVDRDRIVDPHVFHGPANVVGVFFKFELGRMDADHDQSLISIFVLPGADIGKRAPPVYAGVGPEIDEDDLSA